MKKYKYNELSDTAVCIDCGKPLKLRLALKGHTRDYICHKLSQGIKSRTITRRPAGGVPYTRTIDYVKIQKQQTLTYRNDITDRKKRNNRD